MAINTEEEAIELASKPHLILTSEDCNTVIGYLNAYIAHLDLEEWQLELDSNNHRVLLLQQEGKSIPLKEAEWKISEPYRKWRETQLEVRKFRNYRNALRKREDQLLFKEKLNKPYINKSYLG